LNVASIPGTSRSDTQQTSVPAKKTAYMLISYPTRSGCVDHLRIGKRLR
jgi:hypothetical protein